MLRPFGHVRRYEAVPCFGTTTQGPLTRMHDGIPWHSFVAEPAGANAAAVAIAATNASTATFTGSS